MKIQFGKVFLADFGHKMTVVRDEPDLQESYNLTQDQIDAFWKTIPMNPCKSQEIEIPEHMLECVNGEMENMAEIYWSNARQEGIRAIGAASNIERQLEKLNRK